MSRALTPVLFFIALVSCAAATVQTPEDAAPLDTAQVLLELDSLATLREKKMTMDFFSKQKELSVAAAGGSEAAETYKKAVEALHTEPNASFSDWSRDKSKMLRSEEMQNAIMFHTRYLLLGMKARKAAATPGESDETALQFIVYCRQLSEILSKKDAFSAAPKEARELLDKPAHDGVFARWLGLGDYLPAKQNWEERPGNIEGILEKNARVPLRASRNPAVLATWDLQIELLRRRALRDSDAAKLQISEIELPRALFGRASDKRRLGLRNGFLRDTLALAKQHPGHPDWEKWSEAMREELATPPASPPETNPELPGDAQK